MENEKEQGRDKRNPLRGTESQEERLLIAELQRSGFTQEEIAKNLGIKRPKVAKIFKELTNQGKIEVRSRRPTYKETTIFPQKLKRYVELVLESQETETVNGCIRIKLLNILTQDIGLSSIRFLIEVMEMVFTKLMIPEHQEKDKPYLLLLRAVFQKDTHSKVCFWPTIWRQYLEHLSKGDISIPNTQNDLQKSLVEYCVSVNRHLIAPIWQEGEVERSVKEQLDLLSNQQKEVVSLIFGINTSAITPTGIAKILGVERQQIHQVYNLAISGLRIPARSRYLEIFLQPIMESLKSIKRVLREKDAQINNLQGEIETLKRYQEKIGETLISDLSLLPILTLRLDTLPLHVRLLNCLSGMKIVYLGELIQKKESEFQHIWSMGEKTRQQVFQLVRRYGLRLGTRLSDELETLFRQSILEAEQEEKRGKTRSEESQQDILFLLRQPIEELEISDRIKNCLKRIDIYTIGALVQKTSDEITAPGSRIAIRSLKEIKTALERIGLSLNMSFEPHIEQLLLNEEDAQRRQRSNPWRLASSGG